VPATAAPPNVSERVSTKSALFAIGRQFLAEKSRLRSQTGRTRHIGRNDDVGRQLIRQVTQAAPASASSRPVRFAVGFRLVLIVDRGPSGKAVFSCRSRAASRKACHPT
jgi:hypothetical protein